MKNLDLDKELELLELFRLTPDNSVVFKNKHTLLRSQNAELDISLSDYLLIKKMEEGIDKTESKRLDNLLTTYPDVENEALIYPKTKLHRENVIYPHKNRLHRKTIFTSYFYRAAVAVAAATIGLTLYFGDWFSSEPINPTSQFIAKTEISVEPKIENRQTIIPTVEVGTEKVTANKPKETKKTSLPATLTQQPAVAAEIEPILAINRIFGLPTKSSAINLYDAEKDIIAIRERSITNMMDIYLSNAMKTMTIIPDYEYEDEFRTVDELFARGKSFINQRINKELLSKEKNDYEGLPGLLIAYFSDK